MTEEKSNNTEFLSVDEVSQKLFNKDFSDIKYLLCTNYVHQTLLDEENTRTGLYQWLNVFDGDVKYPRDVDDFNKYDIIQINMSTQDLPLINTIKSQLNPNNTRTKIVVNNDYTTELWGASFPHPDTLAREIQNADMIFGTEYFQVSTLSELVKRKVFIIPHPADVRRLKSLPSIEKKPIISTIWRRYDNFSYVPHFAVRNHGLTTRLIGFDKDKDSRTWLTTSLYDYVLAGTNFFDFTSQLKESMIVYDPFTLHSYNRAGVDCAAMGVAIVGSNRTQSMNVCYPYTTVDPYDTASARVLINKLLTDKEFYNTVIETAKKNVEIYSHDNSAMLYMNSLLDSLDENSQDIIVNKPKVSVKGTGTDILVGGLHNETKKDN